MHTVISMHDIQSVFSDHVTRDHHKNYQTSHDRNADSSLIAKYMMNACCSVTIAILITHYNSLSYFSASGAFCQLTALITLYT